MLDTTPPSLAAPAGIAVDATGPETEIDLGNATASDAVDPSPAVSSDAPGAFGLGTTVVAWTAADASGNSAGATQSVAVLACGRPHGEFNVITGTAGDDVITGTAGDDVIMALAGDDVVLAGAGRDCILAGAGDDVVRGEAGDDVIDGGAGDDVIDGGAGRDSCAAGPEGSGGGLAANCE